MTVSKTENLKRLIVVRHPAEWKLNLPGVEVISSKDYLTRPEYALRGRIRVYNLARHYRYQKLGYYVSLLAGARGHRVMPSVGTIESLKNPVLIRLVHDELDTRIQKALAPLQGDHFTLSIYFGRNMSQRYSSLCLALFAQFQAPLLRAEFKRDGLWKLKALKLLTQTEVPSAHYDFLVSAAESYFRHETPATPLASKNFYSLAILVDPHESNPPSNKGALDRVVTAGRRKGMSVDLITRDDYATLAEYDALFIRATTNVSHFTYRFASRAVAEDLVVIDDPNSIIRCSNKVYLAELLATNRIRAPRTFVAHSRNLNEVGQAVGFPCVLKQPDSAFSKGVVKAEDEAAFLIKAEEFLKDSDLIVVQEYLVTDFDWRICVLEGKALFACRYYMVKGHWQVADHSAKKLREGKVGCVALDDVPSQVLKAAVKAAALVGKGFYGVDVKELKGRAYVIEINDNPNIEHGFEDKLLKETLYDTLIDYFYNNIRQMHQRGRR